MSRQKKDCPFCHPESERILLLESNNSYAIFDKFPVSTGHILIIPKRHCPNYFELTVEEQSACWSMVNQAKDILRNRFDPDGFNIGININESAGQTIFHAHIRLIPRYIGDAKDPRGGIRGIIPEKKVY